MDISEIKIIVFIGIAQLGLIFLAMMSAGLLSPNKNYFGPGMTLVVAIVLLFLPVVWTGLAVYVCGNRDAVPFGRFIVFSSGIGIMAIILSYISRNIHFGCGSLH